MSRSSGNTSRSNARFSGNLRSRRASGGAELCNCALRLGAIGYDAVKHLVLCRYRATLAHDSPGYIPTCLGPTWRPRPHAYSYMSLLGGGAS